MQWEPWCMRNPKKPKSPNQKGEKYTLPKLNSKKSSPIKMQLNKVLQIEAGKEKKSFPFKQMACPKENLANFKTKNKNEMIKKPCHYINIHNEKTLKKSPSHIVYSRKFSKYNECIQKKLKAEFKSNFKSSGKFDKQSNKYKAYIKKNRNENNKSLLKYSICSSRFNEVKKKKRTNLCSDLPGKGTYNHRFAYDEALQLNKQGIDVDVMYKVKNKTDSIYVINGEFLRPKNVQRLSKQQKDKSVINNISKVQNPIYEESGFEEMTKLKKNDLHLQKQNSTRIGSIQKAKAKTGKERINEELNIKRELKELQAQLEAEKRNNKLMRKILKLKEKLIDKKPCLTEKQQLLEEMNVDDVNIQAAERLWRLKIQQNLAANCKKNMNVIDKIPVINSVNGTEELEVYFVYRLII